MVLIQYFLQMFVLFYFGGVGVGHENTVRHSFLSNRNNYSSTLAIYKVFKLFFYKLSVLLRSLSPFYHIQSVFLNKKF